MGEREKERQYHLARRLFRVCAVLPRVPRISQMSSSGEHHRPWMRPTSLGRALLQAAAAQMAGQLDVSAPAVSSYSTTRAGELERMVDRGEVRVVGEIPLLSFFFGI